VNVWSTFWRFSLWALQFLLFEQFRWISLAILVLLGIATVVTLNSSAARSRPITSYLFPLLLSAAFPLTIAIAVLFPARSAANPNHVGQWLMNGLDILCALFAIYCVYRAKGIRWFAAALVIAELWIIFIGGFISGMAVAGDWI
jgi:hypothetical protein